MIGGNVACNSFAFDVVLLYGGIHNTLLNMGIILCAMCGCIMLCSVWQLVT